jgi:hypothetical protein
VLTVVAAVVGVSVLVDDPSVVVVVVVVAAVAAAGAADTVVGMEVGNFRFAAHGRLQHRPEDP